jgi:2-iminobutanoate/2-iminopropanoate deaminase
VPPIGPYTPVIRAGDFLIVSGQLGLTAEGEFVAGGVAAQTGRAIANIGDLLASEGASLTDVVKTTVFLTSMDDYATMNEAYSDAFGETRPARSAFCTAGLPRGAAVEIEAWAYKPSS